MSTVVDNIKKNAYGWPDYPMRRDTIHIGSGTYSILAFKTGNPGS
jgi:hypothetical protein